MNRNNPGSFQWENYEILYAQMVPPVGLEPTLEGF